MGEGRKLTVFALPNSRLLIGLQSLGRLLRLTSLDRLALSPGWDRIFQLTFDVEVVCRDQLLTINHE